MWNGKKYFYIYIYICVCMCIYIYMYIYYLSAFNYLICFIISQISTPFAASKAGSFSRFKCLACCAMYEKRLPKEGPSSCGNSWGWVQQKDRSVTNLRESCSKPIDSVKRLWRDATLTSGNWYLLKVDFHDSGWQPAATMSNKLSIFKALQQMCGPPPLKLARS